jgi:hypothetical protein
MVSKENHNTHKIYRSNTSVQGYLASLIIRESNYMDNLVNLNIHMCRTPPSSRIPHKVQAVEGGDGGPLMRRTAQGDSRRRRIEALDCNTSRKTPIHIQRICHAPRDRHLVVVHI